MEALNNILIGIIQGLTEFLPISSSGHLVLSKYLLGMESENIALEVFVHFGTLISVIVYFRFDIKNLIIEGIRYFPDFIKYGIIGVRKNIDPKNLYYPYYIYFIILGTIPAAIVGLLYKDEIEHTFSDPKIALVCLMVTGIILLLSKLAKDKNRKLGAMYAIIIGIAQSIAILPGISRSGSTIVSGMFLGINKETVAKFSFLMSLPAIFGAFILQISDLMALEITPEQWVNYSLAIIASAFSGYYAIHIVMDFVKKGRFMYFGFYCIMISIIGMIFI